MSERLETWVHDEGLEAADLDIQEQAMAPELADAIYELERCIECGCCIAACGTAQMRDHFVGAVGLNQISRFRLDPRDKRSDAEFYQLVGDDSGVFGCMTLLGCEDLCPKDLPLATQIAFLRRRMVAV
jgi:fumarate reductase iron-sulfur subunit